VSEARFEAGQAPATAAADESFRLPAMPPWLGPALAVLLCVSVASYPLFDSTFFGMGRIELTLFYMMAAIGLNFVHGFGGVLMVGQPALMTVGGYTAGILSTRYGWEFLATFPIAIAAAVALSVFMCSPSLRVQGWYLAVLSFMGVALVPDVVYAFYETTGGGDGLPGIAPVEFFGNEPPRWVVFELVLLLTIIFFVTSRNLIKSGWGTSLLALRDHPYMATASGVNRIRVRAAVFTLSGIPCGVAGAMYAHSQEFFSASNFGPTIVLLLIGGVLLGGRGTLWGPVFGVTIFSAISLWLGPFNIWNPFILGMGVLAAAVLFRFGIVGTAVQFWGKHGPSKGAAARLLTEEVDTSLAIAPLEAKPVLGIRGVTKHFGGTYALQDIDLTAKGGSIVVVIGANGSGKTTLLNCVNGFVKPDSGEIALDGDDIASVPMHRRAHRGIGRTFQVPRLVEELTVRQNVELGVFGLHPQTVGASMFRLPWYYSRQAAAAEKAVAACRALGLSERAISAQASELTLALKRMVEIARALAADASLICLDEPVAGLNVVAQERVATVLRELAASGRAVLLIEHNLPFVLSVADELILLREGRVEDRGSPADAGDPNRPLGSYFQTFVAKADQAKVEEAIRKAAAARGQGDAPRTP
jgi:branched-chain amino acid transport system permease protein